MGLVINGPVGKGPKAQNRPVDVSAVEDILKARCDGESGIVGTAGGGAACAPQTIAAIVAYQKQVLKLPFPDGLVVPNGTTVAFLNDPNKRWKGVPKPGAEKPGVTDTPTPSDLPPIEQGAAVLAKLPEPDRTIYGQYYRDNVENWIKGIGGSLGRIEDFRVVGTYIYYCRQLGLNPGKITSMFNVLRKIPPKDLKLIIGLMEPGGKFGRLIAGGAKFGEGMGIAALIVDVYIYGKNDDWGAALGEIYKFAMNKAVPWAGMIEGLQSMLDVLPIDAAKKTLLFKVLRFIDPVGLGGSAFDSIVSLGRFVMSKDPAEGERIIFQATKRLKNGPTGLIKYAGDALGDAVYHFINDPDQPEDVGKSMDRLDKFGPKF